MGCVGSKERRGILAQQKDTFTNSRDHSSHNKKAVNHSKDNIHNNNKINSGTHSNKICLRSEETDQCPSSPLPANGSLATSGQPTPSRHSPPVSRLNSGYNNQLDGLGGVAEVWQNQGRWAEFRMYLANQSEGEDSDGIPILLDRYATFLELFALLDRAERLGEEVEDRRQILSYVTHHEEDFFGRERCLKCVDGGMRKEVLSRLRKVEQGELEPTTHVLAPVYSRVVDRLSELLGNYQNSLIEKISMAEQR